VQAVVDQCMRGIAERARCGGHVDESDALRVRDRARGGVECIDLRRDVLEIAVLLAGEPCYAPVGNRDDDDAIRQTAGERDRAREQGGEFIAIVGEVAAAVLVVDADQQSDECVRCVELRGVDRVGELVGAPAGFGDDLRIVERDAVRAQAPRQLCRPAFVGGDAFADRVGIAERNGSVE